MKILVFSLGIRESKEVLQNTNPLESQITSFGAISVLAFTANIKLAPVAGRAQRTWVYLDGTNSSIVR